jgi:arsenite-transporting ATPase
VTKLARPVLARVSSVPVMRDRVFAALRRFYDRLDGVRDLLIDGSVTSVRLVVNAERIVIAEARRTYTYLSLFGYHVDAVIANRLLPSAVDESWFDRWRQLQAQHLETITAAFAPVPVLRSELAGDEVIGLDALDHLGTSIYGTGDPAARRCATEPMRIDHDGDALFLSLHLPFAEKQDVELGRATHELYLAVGPHRRSVVLPDALARREVASARFEDDRLVVEFVR